MKIDKVIFTVLCIVFSSFIISAIGDNFWQIFSLVWIVGGIIAILRARLWK